MKKKLLRILLPIFFIIIYGIFAVWRFSYVGINSDFANLVLEADDVLSGNFLRNGWYLTGISFFTTDLLYFMAGVKLFGVSNAAYYFACGAMYTALIAVSWLLIRDVYVGRRPDSWQGGKEEKASGVRGAVRPKFIDVIFGISVFLAFALIPSMAETDLVRAHTGVFVFAFLDIWLFVAFITQYDRHAETSLRGNCQIADRNFLNNRWISIIFYIIFLALGVAGDPIILIMLVASVLLWALIAWLRHDISTGEFLKYIAINAAGAAFGTIIDHIYFAVSNCHKNSFLEDRLFSALDEVHDKSVTYIRAVLQMADAGFEGNMLTDIQTLFYAINTVAVIVFLALIIINIVFFIIGKKYDVVTVLLGIGFLAMSALFVLTNISVDITSARYISYMPPFMAICFVRNADLFFEKKNRLYGLIFVLMIIAIFGKIRGIRYSGRSLPYAQIELMETLQANGLDSGYSTFWSSSSTTVISDDSVKVRAILGINGRIAPDKWYCKEDWYRQYANFVVTTPNDVSGVTEENMLAILGKPAEIIDCGQYRILVYDEDISAYMQFDSD